MKCRSLARVVEDEQSSPTPEVVDERNVAFRRRLRVSLRAQLPEQRCEPRSPPPKIQETAVAAGDSHATQPMKGKGRSPPPDADVGVSLKSKISHAEEEVAEILEEVSVAFLSAFLGRPQSI